MSGDVAAIAATARGAKGPDANEGEVSMANTSFLIDLDAVRRVPTPMKVKGWGRRASKKMNVA